MQISQENIIQKNISNEYEKNIIDAQTPSTFGSINEDLYIKDKNGKSNKPSFEEIEQFNASLFLKPEHAVLEQSNMKQKFDAKHLLFPYIIKFQVISPNGMIVHVVIKQIQSADINENMMKLIFENKLQQSQLNYDICYKIRIIIELDGGFERELGENIFIQRQRLQQKLEKNIEMNTSSQVCCKFYTGKAQNKFYLSFIDFKCNVQAIQAIHQLKFKLINKSQQLNQIKKLIDLKGVYYTLSKQNMGSRILQKLMNKSSFSEIIPLINQLKMHFEQLIPDMYGNYVFQKIIELSPIQFKHELLIYIKPFFIRLLETKAGTHTLQKMLQFMDAQGIQIIITILKYHEISLSQNQFATHFIQRLISIYPVYEFIQFFLKPQNFTILACNKYSIVVLKSLLKICVQNEYLRYQFLEVSINCFKDVIYHEFGHYIIQQLLNYYNHFQLQNLLSYIVYYAVDISNNQFSSSIIRKGLQSFRDYWSQPIMFQLLEKQGLSSLLESKSGSFVIHRLLDLSNNYLKAKFILELKSLTPKIKNYEKRNKWRKYFNIK